MSATNISVSDLSWGQRFAIINAYHPTDEDACKALGVTKQELRTAQTLIGKGVFQVDTTLNVEPYGFLFGQVTSTNRKISLGGSGNRRGRKGNKIQDAFAAIPEVPTDANKFIELHGISMPVLRQFKRFDTTGLPGMVNVRKRDGMLMVWRSAETESEPEAESAPE